MAGKIEVYGVRVTKTGLRQVELPAGWVGYDAMTAARQDAVRQVLLAKLPDAEMEKFTERSPMQWQFMDSADWDYDAKDGFVDRQDQGKGSQSGDDSDGNNDDQDGDGQESDDDEIPPPPNGSKGKGDSDGDDEPVMHSEFDPWAHQVGKTVESIKATVKDAMSEVSNALAAVGGLESKLESYGEDVGLLMQASANVQKKLDQINKKVAEVSNGNNGSGGAVTVKIEIIKPGEPQYDKEGVFHYAFPTLAKLVAGGHHVYLPGPPGSGKSHSAEQVAKALGWRFAALSLGPTTPESRLWGGMDANGHFHQTALTDGLIYAEENPDSGFVFCLDELDNGHPGIIATLNSAMANGWVMLPNGRLVRFGRNMVFLGCANTYGTGPTAEFSGRNRLDAATLDRFRYLPWDTDKGMEGAMVRGILADSENGAELAADWLDVWNSARKNVESHGLKVFVTMRGALAGATMLAQGFDIIDTFNMVLLNKLPADQAGKINPL